MRLTLQPAECRVEMGVGEMRGEKVAREGVAGRTKVPGMVRRSGTLSNPVSRRNQVFGQASPMDGGGVRKPVLLRPRWFGLMEPGESE